MTDDEFEFVLVDRIAKIKSIFEQYDNNSIYVSHSGGKDSQVVSKLIDLAIPDNTIPRVYINTGIEYPQMINFVKSLAETDDRFIIIQPKKNVRKTLNADGYPFKSKQHAHNFMVYRNNVEQCDKVRNELLQSEEKLFNYKYISKLPKGTKTFVKYYFGIREKDTPIGVDERERERERYIYKYQDCP